MGTPAKGTRRCDDVLRKWGRGEKTAAVLSSEEKDRAFMYLGLK